MRDKKEIEAGGAAIDVLLKHPDVKRVTANINPDLTSRRTSVSSKCKVFTNPYTRLVSDKNYIFDIHPESERQLPDIIKNQVQKVVFEDAPDFEKTDFEKGYKKKRNIGIVFSGGPAPGGHNVIAGLFDAAISTNPENKIFGFLKGPDGIIENEYIEITKELVSQYKNTGGFSMIRTGRTKIDTKEKMDLSKRNCKKLELDALVVVGGDDSNTNAAFLAQEMCKDNIQVIGVPKTIDGDIQVRDLKGNSLCAMSFGFHTAARAFAGSVSNLCTDSGSDIKYWHICKVMGRVASHLALEVALQTHANVTLVGEELADFVDEKRIQKAEEKGDVDYTAYGMTLRNLSRMICEGIVERAKAGKNYGVIVIPEGVLEFINEIQTFIIKFNTIIADYNAKHDTGFHADFSMLEDKLRYLRKLAQESKREGRISVWNTRDDELFNDIPSFFQEGLLMERDSHGNFQFSQVETDKVLMRMVKEYLGILKEEGEYKLGIEKNWYEKTMEKGNLDPDEYGPVLFDNHENGEYLLVRPSIISLITLKQALIDKGLIKKDDLIPDTVKTIYRKSDPTFKTQTHFFGYDGRGSEPTHFDCTYTYNLGLTVFSLIANGATGQMAAIKNLEFEFDKWEPVGIPIAPLMHLEERKGKMSLVLERSVVDLNSNAFCVFKALRKKWLAANSADDNYRKPGPIQLTGNSIDDRPLTLVLNAVDIL
ncbi:6-phosphofructokinase [Desulfobacterales bacterium HSG16]|nr:6-phosphofructokinase [Desulfobacterales bacterium HSG16]